jgi:hypothetical protein
MVSQIVYLMNGQQLLCARSELHVISVLCTWAGHDVSVASTGKESSATVTEWAPLSTRPRRKPVPL